MAGLIVIAGPTAGGKSALALAMARALDGVIVNADSMQLYRDLRIVTARPSALDEACVPHRLFGVRDGADPGSVGDWLGRVEAVLAEAGDRGWLPIVVGGTGLYLEALLEGLAEVPEIPRQLRQTVRERYGALGAADLHAALAELDPETAAGLRPSDRQRLLRALEVRLATGRPLAHFQAGPRVRIELPEPVVGLKLLPPREAIHRRIADRLRAMVEGGGSGGAGGAATAAPRSGAADHEGARRARADRPLAGGADLESALARATTATRRYAKRQLTWLRHRLPRLQAIDGFGDAPERLEAADPLGRLLLTGQGLPHSVQSTRKTGP